MLKTVKKGAPDKIALVLPFNLQYIDSCPPGLGPKSTTPMGGNAKCSRIPVPCGENRCNNSFVTASNPRLPAGC